MRIFEFVGSFCSVISVSFARGRSENETFFKWQTLVTSFCRYTLKSIGLVECFSGLCEVKSKGNSPQIEFLSILCQDMKSN